MCLEKIEGTVTKKDQRKSTKKATREQRETKREHTYPVSHVCTITGSTETHGLCLHRLKDSKATENLVAQESLILDKVCVCAVCCVGVRESRFSVHAPCVYFYMCQ